MHIPGELHLYTDGACSDTRGGFAAILLNPVTMANVALAEGPYIDTTNNQMEMMAVIAGLEFAHTRIGAQHLRVFSDSKYVIEGITKWIHGWRARNWKTAKGEHVKNIELWHRMDAARALHKAVIFQWVKGHNGNDFNEMADALCVKMRERQETARRLKT